MKDEEEKELKIFESCCWKDKELIRFFALFHDPSFSVPTFLHSSFVSLLLGQRQRSGEEPQDSGAKDRPKKRTKQKKPEKDKRKKEENRSR